MDGTISLDTRIHDLRVDIDRVIKLAQTNADIIGRDAGGREISLVITKLQEGKMWAGKILEAIGSPFPEELKDEAK